MYFYGSGKIFIGTRDAGGKFEPGAEFHCPSFEVEVEDERLQHKNTSGAKRVLDLDISLETMPKVKISIDTYSEEILAMALGGEATEKTSGSSFLAASYPFPSGIAVNDVVPVPGGFSNLESLVITDSNGTPATLTAGTHYTVDLASGLVTFLNLGAFTQPFKAAGSENDNFHVISIGTATKKEKFVRFSGVNVADEDQKPHIIDLYRASFKPTKVAPKQTGSDVATFEFDVPLLADPNAPFSEDFGQYGRYVKG
jgi:hypothetical protein